MGRKTRMTAAAGALAVTLIGGFEGLRLAAYPDPIGIPTICYGETKGVKLGDVKTKAECDTLLITSIRAHEMGMRRCLVDPDAIPIKSYVAFVSFAYNVGVGNFCKSTLARKVNAGDIVGACNELPRWTRAGGRVLRGLVNRRSAEQDLCLEGAGQ